MQQSAGTLDLYSMQIRASAFEGELVSVTDLLADLLALTGSATLDGLTAQGNAGCDQLLCNDVNCTDVFTTCGRLGRRFLRSAYRHKHRRRSHAVVHRGRVRQLAEHYGRGQRGLAELSHRNHGQHVNHQQHGQHRELYHGGRRVHGDIDGLGRSNRGELRSHRGAHGRHAEKNLTGTARWSDGTEMVTLACLGGVQGLSETIKAVYEDPRTGFGSIAQTLQQA